MIVFCFLRYPWVACLCVFVCVCVSESSIKKKNIDKLKPASNEFSSPVCCMMAPVMTSSPEVATARLFSCFLWMGQ